MSTTSRALRELLIEKAAYQREAVNGALDDILLLCEQAEADHSDLIEIERVYELVAARLVTSDMRSDFEHDEDADGPVAPGDDEAAPRG